MVKRASQFQRSSRLDDYTLAWVKDFSLRRDWTREHLNSKGLLAWATIFSSGRNYLLAWSKYLLFRQNWTWEYLSDFQVNSLGRKCLVWVSYAEKTTPYQMNHAVCTTTKLPCLSHMTRWDKINMHTWWMIYLTQIIYLTDQFLQSHIIHAKKSNQHHIN